MIKRVTIFCLLCVFCFSLSAQLPITYDLRDVNGINFVTAVKSQQGGTCWTHGAMASIESNLLMTNRWTIAGDTGEPNLAEYHLDWWNGFNDHYNADNNPTSGSGLAVHMGGDYRVTAAYNGRGDGSVRDIDGQSYNTAPLYHDSSYRYYYTPHIEWLKLGNKLENIDFVKQTLMDNGAIGTCMCVGAFWGTNNTHYQPPSDASDPNHAIAIIGWNDTLLTDSGEPGAWLCKNSWGANWGDNGYFWISYFDKHCGKHPEMGLITFRDVEVMKYDNVFYHDYHGWRDTLTQISEAFNQFYSENQQAIKALSFYTAEDSVTYQMKVYLDFDGISLDSCVYTKAGDISISGFHTIELDSAILIDSNTLFYTYVNLNKGGHAIDITSSVPVLLGASSRTLVTSYAGANESFYFDNGVWDDLFNYPFTQYGQTANFCIKALCDDTSFVIPPPPPNGMNSPEVIPFEINLYPNPSSDIIGMHVESETQGNLYYTIYSSSGEQVVSNSEQVNIGMNNISISGFSQLSSGVYMIKVQTNECVVYKKIIKQ